MTLSLRSFTRFRAGALSLVLLLVTSLLAQAKTIRYMRTDGTNAEITAGLTSDPPLVKCTEISTLDSSNAQASHPGNKTNELTG